MAQQSCPPDFPRHSETLLLDPVAYVESVKQKFQDKDGIPCEQQRLVFGHHARVEPGASEAGPSTNGALGDLESWEAILYRNEKAVGRLKAPVLLSEESHPASSRLCDVAEGLRRTGIACRVYHLAFSKWLPAWRAARSKGSTTGGGEEGVTQLYLPLDGEDFMGARFRLDVLGRDDGKAFALPFKYHMLGKEAASAVQQEIQRGEYIRRHQLARGGEYTQTPRVHGLEPFANGEDICFRSGVGLERFTAVVNVEDKPAWVKAFIVTFVVVPREDLASAALPEAIPPADEGDAAGGPAVKRQPIVATNPRPRAADLGFGVTARAEGGGKPSKKSKANKKGKQAKPPRLHGGDGVAARRGV
eukprot:CAMPEP_0182860236 /NCGR_PEP_ID=MMETSP0034_2-20130328/4798_1 /TAXON_ID=156128 /ORGANISM="Nephroselmis pyriformis, Strain CCMP717" /LENGTH=359 /DNA_ID=CAMNT_0024992003 /DNA_START=1359 /DNA_END=2435 /DNA_ORIENTATION=+